MSSVPLSQEQLSLRLPEVLSDIGVNHKMIMKRREGVLFRECVLNIDSHSSDSNDYLFGSQSEGSTTLGLYSDHDMLTRETIHYVIHDLVHMKPGVINVLMVQDETTAPGYCLLQHVGEYDSFVPTRDSPCIHIDVKGRSLLSNVVARIASENLGYVQHGPAAMPRVEKRVAEVDVVVALYCPRWSVDVRRWPTAELKSEFETLGCFLVPVASKSGNGLDELEWRISTSLHERHLMFSLNTTQMSCYVLMKMLLKSHRAFKDVISSYMCKTALFHCIENTKSDFWREHNLISCLRQILWVLNIFIYCKNCPHFIIPENNLMAGRITTEQKYKLLKAIQYILSNTVEALFEIQIDDAGERLQMKMNTIREYSHHVLSPVELQRLISGRLCYESAQFILVWYCNVLKIAQYDNKIQDTVLMVLAYLSYYIRYNQKYPDASNLEQKAYRYILPLFCSTIGSLLASYYIALNKPLLGIVWEFLKLGYNSDVSSSLLKLATVCYSVGDLNVTKSILCYVDKQCNRDIVMPVCGCYGDFKVTLVHGFCGKADQTQINDFSHIVSYCVRFLPFETHVVPHELRQEYSRSTQADILSQDKSDRWMDCAVVGSLPYLYFLQYKTYGRLRDLGKQQRALDALQQVIRDEPNIHHRETALNLLGQCMEQENQRIEALQCYERSLQVRSRNNAANFHMSRLLARLNVPTLIRKRKFYDI